MAGLVIEIRDGDGWTEARCRCGEFRTPIAAAAVALPADVVRGGLLELVDHARICAAASDGNAELVERLTRERFRPSPLH